MSGTSSDGFIYETTFMPFFLKVKYKLDPSVYQYQILIQSQCDMSDERQADKYGGFAGQLSLISFSPSINPTAAALGRI